jgi:hypothetical protein
MRRAHAWSRGQNHSTPSRRRPDADSTGCVSRGYALWKSSTDLSPVARTLIGCAGAGFGSVPRDCYSPRELLRQKEWRPDHSEACSGKAAPLTALDSRTAESPRQRPRTRVDYVHLRPRCAARGGDARASQGPSRSAIASVLRGPRAISRTARTTSSGASRWMSWPTPGSVLCRESQE